MSETNKYRLLITKLMQETQRDNVKWRSEANQNIKLPFEAEVIDKIYLTNYKGTNFRMFKFKYKQILLPQQTYSWYPAVRLEIVDYNENAEWSFPVDNVLNDLYEIVRYKTANIGALIDNILGIDIIKAEYGTNKKSLDITKQLTTSIHNNELHVLVSNDIAGDPDEGTPKFLKVKYSYQGKIFEKEIPEGTTFNIP
jgi:hypothetical protein